MVRETKVSFLRNPSFLIALLPSMLGDSEAKAPCLIIRKVIGTRHVRPGSLNTKPNGRGARGG